MIATLNIYFIYLFIYQSIHIKEHSLQNDTVKKDKTNVRIEWPTQGSTKRILIFYFYGFLMTLSSFPELHYIVCPFLH